MAFTHKTVTEWNVSAQEQRAIPELMEERTEWLKQAVEDGKTDTVIGTALSDDEDGSAQNAIGERVWNNQTSAQSWKTFVEELATKHNKQVTVTISEV